MKVPAAAPAILAQFRARAKAIAAGDQGLYTVAEVCRLLGVTKQTITAWVAKGTIPYYRLGSLLRFDPAELVTWLEHRASR